MCFYWISSIRPLSLEQSFVSLQVLNVTADPNDDQHLGARTETGEAVNRNRVKNPPSYVCWLKTV